ncbi:MAG: carboxypeptidase regulatory-like domain-containing protein [Ruminococcaceae bacterium]|nr:carboxypeptidase regulatory-like domain-containing protein [Oscillospiraceae bacterium]
MKRIKLKAFLASFMALLMLVSTAPISVTADTQPEIWYTKSDVTIDKHILFGEDKMYTDGKSNRGFDCLVDNNTGTIFYVSTADPEVNYQNLSGNGKEIMVTVHMSQPVVIDHFKIVAGADTFKANYAHRNPVGWNLKAGNSADSCSAVLVANETIDASEGYKQNVYSFNNTTAYQYYQFTITALAGAGRSGHDVPFSNPTATCTLADIAFGGPEPISHTDHDDINFTKWNSTNSLPTTAGNYFLDKDVTISSTWNVPSGTTNLCLNGHGIKMTGNSSVMTVSAGATLKIYDCDTETEHRFSVSNKKSNGAGFATVNDSLTSGYETFTGGYITGGKGTRVNNWSRGGAFYISGAVEMYGGTVIGNGQYGTTHGGGFSTIESGTFKMYGGSIQNNAGQCGGATRLQGAVCEILGGKIINNVVSADGGGIHVGGTIPVILKDCEISGNYAENGPGAGIWMTTTGTEVSGSTVIENNLTSKGVSNIELGNGYTIAVGTLNNDAKIGIKMNNGTGVFTSGWNTYMSGKDPAYYFTSDDTAYGVILGGSNEAEIGDDPAASIINGETTTKYPSFSDALSNWSEGSTLKLLKDATTSTTINVPSGEHTLDLNGYGILMTGNGRVLTINKNVSLELNDSNPERIHYITLSDYRGTAVSNSGETSVSNGNGVIKVTGGYLTGGFLNNSGSHDKCGAGVFNWGTFVMNGGNIVGNTMQNNSGGGIRNSGFFTMNDGTIAFNKASVNGGGVTTYVPGGGQGKMTMNGGVISDNYCGSYGGGIQLAGPFELTGGSVTRNTAGAGGSGVFYGGQGDKFKLSGNPIIKDNVNDDLYLNADATFMISDSLTEGAEIGILMNKNAVFTSGWKDKMGDADPADYFMSDNSDYAVALADGEAVIRYPDLTGVTASGFESDYDGMAHGITVTAPNGATIKYGTSEGSYTLSENPTYTDAGTYTVYYQVSKDKYTPVTGFETVTINKINATVTITGHTLTVDYNGSAHSADGYDAVASSNLYDVNKDFTFSGTDEAKRTDAGLTNMGLKANQFKNTNPNFATVTFDITDGYIKVDPIDVTVTITGHILTVDYNGNAHSADGYDAEADSALYDVTKDFVYHGRAQAIRTDAGTTYMNLDSAKFENTNPNFATVAFNVIKDGYVEINKVDAVITKKPSCKSKLVYTGDKQKLITAGSVDGGTLYYALGKNDKTEPADNQFKADVPSATEVGNYYIWYKVKADSNHYSLSAVCFKITLAEKDWVTVRGTVYNDKGEPQSGADVTLTSGNKTIDTILSDANGEYYFTVPAGVYNIVTSEDGKSQTTKVELYQDKTQNVNMLNTKTESIVKVNSDNDFGVVVDGLNQEADKIRKADKLKDSQSLSLVMTVEAKTTETAKNSKSFNNLSKNSTFEYFDISLEKTVDSVTTVLNSSETVLEIAVPYEKMNRKDIAAYYCDGSEVKKLTESKSKEAGTYWIDKENGIIYIYSKKFATFAIGYTPYYLVDSSIDLGSFTGNATVVIKGTGGEGTYTLENVSPAKLSFDNIPKGEYEMTVTWVDGVENKLTVDVTVA